MSALKRLFGPQALAAVAATGMMTHVVLNAVADPIRQSTSTVGFQPTCTSPNETMCSEWSYQYQAPRYWCCPSGWQCDGFALNDHSIAWFLSYIGLSSDGDPKHDGTGDRLTLE
jgi:hypothetical protein